MTPQRLLLLTVASLLALLLTWGFATNRWRGGRPAVIGMAIVAVLLVLTRRVSLLELVLVLTVPVFLLAMFGRRQAPRGPRGRR